MVAIKFVNKHGDELATVSGMNPHVPSAGQRIRLSTYSMVFLVQDVLWHYVDRTNINVQVTVR